MTINDLFERRAERGLPKGAANVWAAAQHELHHEVPARDRTSVWGLRVALACTGLVLLALAGIRTVTFDDRITSVATPPAAEGVDLAPDGPAPILIDGMTLRGVHEPVQPTEEMEASIIDDSPRVISTVVYAGSTDPFDGPVLGIDTLEGGGFSPWAVNLSDDEFRSLTETIERDGEAWRLVDPSDLIEVAQFTDDPLRMLASGWQFDFADGDETAIIQAEPDATEWLWVARTLRIRSTDEPTTASAIEVLGNDGLVLGDEAFWEADGFVYRLTAGELSGNAVFGKSAAPLVDRLQLVDRADWGASVDRAQRVSGWQSVTYAASLAAVVAWVIASLIMVTRYQRYRLPLVGSGLLGFVLWWGVAPSIWLSLAMIAAAVIVALRFVRRQPPPASA